MQNRFKNYLKNQEFSKHTKDAYMRSLKQFISLFGEQFTKSKLLKYKKWLIQNYKPKTVNARIAGINCFLKCIKREQWSLNVVKLQQKTFLENVISEADYDFLKRKLKRCGNWQGYFIIRFLCATGVRVSEFCQFKVEHVRTGYFDIYGKGQKYRRIYIPAKLQREAVKWFEKTGMETGYIFKTENGTPFKPRMVVQTLKELAKKYGINPAVMYPHSFRHRFAKNFIFKYKDIALLADLMGHESIETTRIYLRRTAFEQKDIVDKIVDW